MNFVRAQKKLYVLLLDATFSSYLTEAKGRKSEKKTLFEFC